MLPFKLVDRRWLSHEAIACAQTLQNDPSVADKPQEFVELAALLVAKWRIGGKRCIGISGGQGAGKSTLCALIRKAGEYFGERIEVLGIDDFYLTKNQRRELGEEVHPLLTTRGPPGTHEVSLLGNAMFEALAGIPFQVPIFDKGLDDRTGFRDVTTPPDRIVVEGWCVGAREQSSAQLREPINALERREDPHGIWRNYVNNCLAGRYREVFSQLDELFFIRVPNLDAVREWRFQQENERDETLRLSKGEIERFILHYERITCWMWADVADRSDVVVDLDHHHQIIALQL